VVGVRGLLNAKGLGLLIGLLAIVLAPLVVKVYQLDILIFLFVNIILVCSYRFNTLTGEWSLIHVVMMGVGGYSSALLTKELGFSFWLALPSAAVVTAAIAFVLRFPLFRMKAFYFLLGSFAAGEAGPELGTIDFFDPLIYYSLTAAIMVICLFVMYRLEKSRIGFTLHAIHWRDVLAESVGVDARRYRSIAFVIASFFAAIAGVLMAHYVGIVTPARFGLHFMLEVLVWVIVGGTAPFVGPILGVVSLTVIDQILRTEPQLEQVRLLIYGLILIVTIRFLPHGIEDLIPRIGRLFGAGNGKDDAKPEGAAAE
jgi:branched-chain amino acid transport system permease protein